MSVFHLNLEVADKKKRIMTKFGNDGLIMRNNGGGGKANKRKNGGAGGSQNSGKGGGQKSKNQGGGATKKAKKIKCFNCREYGHTKADCPKPANYWKNKKKNSQENADNQGGSNDN